ncbi:hypothetical protein PoB_004272300 [Plakobranchus ocellatus]|uniref:Uncharacterized protein n=1 Tax=Plakobranchus ocellatus TaxID=259542 RepID=A0AAV4BAP0_9GAST|nr:hypothetical protein PoB_004272300 [Plakobranchus ocellatus]
MPQATNQRLVSQIAGCPTGHGTVYNALLKTRANNRERVAIANSCERQRLEKIYRSIDKDMHYADWRADQAINKIRGSLSKLLAYQRVLREDFPAKSLSAKISPGRSQNKFDFNEYCPLTQKFLDPITDEADGNYSGSSRDSTSTDLYRDTFHSRNIGRVLAVNRPDHTQNKDTKAASSEWHLNNEQGEENSVRNEKFENVHSENDTQDLGTGKRSYAEREKDSEKWQTVGVKDSPSVLNTNKMLVKNYTNVPPSPPKLLHLRKNQERSKKSVAKEDKRPGILPQVIQACKEEPREKVKNEAINHQDWVTQSPTKLRPRRYLLSDTSEENRMSRPLTDSQRDWHHKRIHRKDAVTQRIFTRGFDMRTLAWEIDRKLVVMDSDYSRRRERREMVQESREEGERLVSRNRAAISATVMPPARQPMMDQKIAVPPGATGVNDTSHRTDATVTSATDLAQQDRCPKEGEEEKTPVMETLTMLNPLLHKIPLSY